MRRTLLLLVLIISCSDGQKDIIVRDIILDENNNQETNDSFNEEDNASNSPSMILNNEYTNIRDIEIIDSIVFISGNSSGSGFVLKSNDLGSTYETILFAENNRNKLFDDLINDVGNYYPNTFFSIEFIDRNRGYVSSSSIHHDSRGYHHSTSGYDNLYYTSDGGNNWEKVIDGTKSFESENRAGVAILDIQIVDENIFVLGPTSQGISNVIGWDIYIKFKNQNNFNRFYPNRTRNTFGLRKLKIVGDRIICTTKGTGIREIFIYDQVSTNTDNSRIILNSNNVYNDGNLWSTALDFKENFGVAIGFEYGTLNEGHIIISSDYGKTWIKKNSQILNNTLVNDLIVDENKNIFVVGDNGTFIYSNDLGETFKQKIINTNSNLNVIEEISENQFMIGGENGFLQIITITP